MPGQVGRGRKVGKGPRALGLLELAPNGKGHLIPITILIDGKYYDASAYKAAPVPMALWSETVYEAVRTGVSQGLFTVTGALERKDAKDAMEWMGDGTWQSADSIKAKVAKKAVSSEPRGMHEDEGPPVLRRAGPERPKSAEPAPAGSAPQQAQPAAPASPTVISPATPPATPAPTASASSPPASPSQQQPAQEDKPPEDKDRPELKRGKAGAESAEEAQKKATATSPAKAVGPARTAPPASAAKKSGSSSAAQPGAEAAKEIQLIPAISDSDGPDPLPYTYNMKPEEEQKFHKQMLAMAADEVRSRAAQLASASAGAPQPVHAPSQRAKTASVKTVQPNFEDVRLRVFDLADINEPELVLMAKARMPQRSHEKQSANSDLQFSDVEYMITLVVREDVNGELHRTLANVTDAEHLDAIPQLELIDAVDVDGDGRGELLFRRVSGAGSAFVVYRVIGDRLYPLFEGTPGR